MPDFYSGATDRLGCLTEGFCLRRLHTIKVRPLYRDPYEIDPTFKIAVVANVRPSLNVHDKALVRRVKLIPFDNTVDAKDRDPRLLDKLKEEASGILNVLVEGAQTYLAREIVEPEAVKAATRGYLADFDSVAGFLKEMVVDDPKSKIAKSDLYAEYLKYCEENLEIPLTQKEFSRVLKNSSVGESRDSSTRYWVGKRLAVGEGKRENLWASIEEIRRSR